MAEEEGMEIVNEGNVKDASSKLFSKLAHFYNQLFTDFLPELTQISKQIFTWINDKLNMKP